MKIKELVQKNNQIIFHGEVMDIYIPVANFDRKLSFYNGQYINTLGVFAFDIKTESMAQKGKFGKFHTLKFPNMINFEYSETFKYTGTLDNGKISKNEYHVFRLRDGDVFINNTVQERSSDAVINFITSLHAGQIPETIPYPELINLYLSTIDINKVNLKNPSVVFELVLSELCRDKKNLKLPFRHTIKNKKTYNEYGYKSINLTQLPSLNSTFAALSFQDFDNSVISGVNQTLNNEDEKESPIEKIVKY